MSHRFTWLATGATLLSLAPAAAHAAGPRVETLVVGKSRTLFGPQTVGAGATTIPASGRRCRVAAGTPAAVLAAARRAGGPSFRTQDTGRCSPSRAGDSAGLYVTQVGPDRRGGPSGWVYKVGATRAGTTSAGDPSGPFGTGRRLHSGQRLLWFYCTLGRSGSCQRTLVVRAPRRVAPGARFTVAVRGYDDNGRGAAIRGARVGGATTDARGRATLRAPRSGALRLVATKAGLVRSFAERVHVG